MYGLYSMEIIMKERQRSITNEVEKNRMVKRGKTEKQAGISLHGRNGAEKNNLDISDIDPSRSTAL